MQPATAHGSKVVAFGGGNAGQLAGDAPGPAGADAPSSRDLLDLAGVGIGQIGLDGRWQVANARLCELLDRPRGELLGTGLEDLLQPQDQAVCAGLLQHLLEGGEPGTTLELECQPGQGAMAWMSLVPTLVRSGEGRPAGFVVVVDDISRRKATEHLHLEREFRLDAIVSNSPSALSLKNPDGRYALANPNLQRIHGLPEGDIVGRTDLELYPAEVAATFRANDARVLQSGERLSVEELVPVHGQMRLYMSHMFPVFDAHRQVRYVCRISLDITDQKRAEQEAEFLAFHDYLTGLPNRRLLLNRLEQALARCHRSGRHGALLLLDLDNFKVINDTLGHPSGDLLLGMVATRLGHALRQGDTVARLGGDEFVVLLEGLGAGLLEAAAQVETVAAKLLAELRLPYALAGRECLASCSIGAAMFGARAQAPDEVMRTADVALYEAKRAGRDTVRFFEQSIQDAVDSRARLADELRHAVVRGELRLYYQVQVDERHRPVGAEALVRWRHPERGMLQPAQFIPLAEETGLIALVGRWVVDTACAQLQRWAGDARTAALALSINVSARELHLAGFRQHVLEAVQRHRVAAGRLTIEVTESSLIDDMQRARPTLQALAAAGIRISLDDFGTGYSSLMHIRQLPIRQLKIDQQFVRNIATDTSDRTIVSTIIAMARSLGLDVIAEGVETVEQLAFLKQHGCREYQGFLFGRPVPAQQFGSELGDPAG